MKLHKQLPFDSEYDGERTECGLWQSAESICEYKQASLGVCDPSGVYYGTLDRREPHFCARHFYQNVVKGNAQAPYILSDRE